MHDPVTRAAETRASFSFEYDNYLSERGQPDLLYSGGISFTPLKNIS